VCDFQELYRYLVDDFVIQYSLKLKPKDFVLKDEYYSINKKGKRQYLKEAKNRDFIKRLNLYFQSKVEIPGTKVGKKQEIETLINEEALLFAKYLGMKERHGSLESWRAQKAVNLLTRYYRIQRMKVVVDGRRVGKGNEGCYDYENFVQSIRVC